MAMEAVGKQHIITLAFLRQAIFELKEAGLDSFVRTPILPSLAGSTDAQSQPCGQIPLFARSRVSKRKVGILPPLPGRLPLSKPLGTRPPSFGMRDAVRSDHSDIGCFDPPFPHTTTDEDESRNANKRRRADLSPEPSSMRSGNANLNWCQHGPVEVLSSSANTPRGSSLSSASRKNTEHRGLFDLPHRGGSSTSGSSPSAIINSGSTSTSSGISPGLTTLESENQVPNGGFMKADQAIDTSVFGVPLDAMTGPVAGANGMVLGMWDTAQPGIHDPSAAFAEVTEAMLNDDSWMMLNEVGVNGQSWDTNGQGTGVG